MAKADSKTGDKKEEKKEKAPAEPKLVCKKHPKNTDDFYRKKVRRQNVDSFNKKVGDADSQVTTYHCGKCDVELTLVKAK